MKTLKESILDNIDVALAKGDNWQNMMELADIFKLLKANTDFKEYKKIGNELFSSLTEVNKNNIKFNKYYLFVSDGPYSWSIKTGNTVQPKKAGVPFYWGVICFNLNSESKNAYSEQEFNSLRYNSPKYTQYTNIDVNKTPTISYTQYGKKFGHKEIGMCSTGNNYPFESYKEYEDLKDAMTFYEIPKYGKEAINKDEHIPRIR